LKVSVGPSVESDSHTTGGMHELDHTARVEHADFASPEWWGLDGVINIDATPLVKSVGATTHLDFYESGVRHTSVASTVLVLDLNIEGTRSTTD